MKATIRKLDRFFFEFSSPVALAAFRWMFGATLLIDVLLRLIHQPSIELYLMILALVPATGGFWGRIGSRLVWIVVLASHTVQHFAHFRAFDLANLGRNGLLEFVSAFWILGLCLTDSSERWSVRALRSKLSFEPRWSRTLTSIGMRLIQIVLCFVYLGIGFGMLHVLDQDLNDKVALTGAGMMGISTWAAVLFGICAPVFVWSRMMRKWILMFGWLVHAGLAVMTGSYIFSLMMMSAYFLFVDSRWLESTFMQSVYMRGKFVRGNAKRIGLRF